MDQPYLSTPVAHLDTLLIDHRAMLVRVCARISGSPDAAEDLAQETLVEAWRHADQLRNPDAKHAWLIGIARNVCLRWRHRQGRERARLALPAADAETGLDWTEQLAAPTDLRSSWSATSW